ncbi:MAG: NLP/P60 hydrolase, partial [Pseudomonadota bacterium]
MADRRLLAANGRVAAAELEGQVHAEKYVQGEAARVIVPVADICTSPEGDRDRQLLYGAAATVYERKDGWAFLRASFDGYVGYVRVEALGPEAKPTHWVE